MDVKIIFWGMSYKNISLNNENYSKYQKIKVLHAWCVIKFFCLEYNEHISLLRAEIKL